MQRPSPVFFVWSGLRPGPSRDILSEPWPIPPSDPFKVRLPPIVVKIFNQLLTCLPEAHDRCLAPFRYGHPPRCRKGMAVVHNSFNDFVLFPQRDGPFLDFVELSKPQDVFQALPFDMNANYQPELSSPEATNYECFSTASAAYGAKDMGYYDTSRLAVNEPKSSFRPTASTSPSSSLSHSLDHAPSNVSNASGASGQSTASSTVGSPYSQTTQGVPAGQDQWIVAGHGLGIASGLATSDAFSGAYHPFSPEADHLTFEDKFSGSFVGEFAQVPRHSTPISSANSSPTSYSSSSRSQNLSSPKTKPVNPELAATLSRSIDTILEEGNGPATDPLSLTFSSSNSTRHPSLIHQTTHAWQPAEDPAVFRSPTAPASSTMNTLPSGYATPNRTYDSDPSRASDQEQAKRQHHHHPAASPTSPIYSSKSHFQSPFFTQSSGNFVAPLESSCWFSL